MKTMERVCMILLSCMAVWCCIMASNISPNNKNVKAITSIACGNTSMFSSNRVTVQSINYPRLYPNNYRCQYEITCTPVASTYLEFRCPQFHLEDSTDCNNDRVIITYTNTNSTRYCGSNSPNGIITTDGWTRVTFNTNNGIQNKGFRCFVWCFNK